MYELFGQQETDNARLVEHSLDIYVGSKKQQVERSEVKVM